ncbi:hypothetical protein B0H34DRAFT_260207 [Crassisporium funariophilum]|nr:hypothetical protein B0H34DRAFT_260207 [Crassisporium funariophilum]
MGLGNMIGAPLSGRLSNIMVVRYRKERGGVWYPENRPRVVILYTNCIRDGEQGIFREAATPIEPNKALTSPSSSRSPSPAYPPSYDSQYLNFDQNADVDDEVPFKARARREPIPSLIQTRGFISRRRRLTPGLRCFSSCSSCSGWRLQ